jgi:hypothetical protein
MNRFQLRDNHFHVLLTAVIPQSLPNHTVAFRQIMPDLPAADREFKSEICFDVSGSWRTSEVAPFGKVLFADHPTIIFDLS